MDMGKLTKYIMKASLEVFGVTAFPSVEGEYEYLEWFIQADSIGFTVEGFTFFVEKKGLSKESLEHRFRMEAIDWIGMKAEEASDRLDGPEKFQVANIKKGALQEVILLKRDRFYRVQTHGNIDDMQKSLDEGLEFLASI